jgi:hypothetical protein
MVKRSTTAIVLITIIGVIAVVSVVFLSPPSFKGTTRFVKTIVTTTTITKATTTTETKLPWDSNLGYLVVPNNCSGPGLSCFGGNFSEVFIFTCKEAAASPQGCTARVNSTTKYWEYNTITVWWQPHANKTAGESQWENCTYKALGGSPPQQLYGPFPAYCAPIGANGFIMTEPMWAIP